MGVGLWVSADVHCIMHGGMNVIAPCLHHSLAATDSGLDTIGCCKHHSMGLPAGLGSSMGTSSAGAVDSTATGYGGSENVQANTDAAERGTNET